MGFLGTIPAKNLKAVYNLDSRTLTLFADGVVQQFTYGFNFRRDNFVGGLKFTLTGWTGPLSGKTQPYNFNQQFFINLPMPHFNNKTVLIVTSNFPEGKAIDIQYVGIGAKTTKGSKALKASGKNSVKAEPEVPANVTQGNTRINVLLKEPFTIEANARVLTEGALKIEYDKTMLELVNAEIDNYNIVWTFNSLKTGNTQIHVIRYGGIASYITSKTYDVTIFVLK